MSAENYINTRVSVVMPVAGTDIDSTEIVNKKKFVHPSIQRVTSVASSLYHLSVSPRKRQKWPTIKG